MTVAVDSRKTGVLVAEGEKRLSQMLVDRRRLKKVMTSPPTPTFTTALTIVSPLHWASVSSASGDHAVGGDSFSYFGCGSPTRAGASFPDDGLVVFPYVSYGTTNFNTQSRVSFMHDGQYLEIHVKGNGGTALVKIDDEYVSLTPQTLTNDGSLYYWYFNLGSRALRRIDLIGYSLRFGGVYTQQTDTIYPAPRRGPKTIIMGDSFVEGTGSTQPKTLVWEFAESLGWDDVWASGIGGSGYLAGPATNPNFRDRVQADVIAHSPDLVMIAGGINDSTLYTLAQIQAEATLLYGTIKSGLPSAEVVVVAPFWTGGPATMSTSIISARDGVRAAAQGFGLAYLDPWELPTNGTSDSTTLSSSAIQTATSLSTVAVLAVRQTYAFADGTRFQVKAIAGSGPYTITIDAPGLQVAQSAGATITKVGNTLLTGNGKVGAVQGYGNADLNVSTDGTHPSDAGHVAIGQCLASLYVDAIQRV